MFGAIRSSHRSTTLITRVKAALPALPHPHRKRRHRAGAAAIVRPPDWGVELVSLRRSGRHRRSQTDQGRVEPMAVDFLLNNDPLIGPGLTPAGARPIRSAHVRGRAYVHAVGRTSTYSIFQQKEQ